MNTKPHVDYFLRTCVRIQSQEMLLHLIDVCQIQHVYCVDALWTLCLSYNTNYWHILRTCYIVIMGNTKLLAPDLSCNVL